MEGKRKSLVIWGRRPILFFRYYLLILIHTAGNPEAVANLRRDCLRPLPLTSDQECVVWEKGRAAHQQIRSYSQREPYKPPDLIRQMKAMTENLQCKVEYDVSPLFLYICYLGERVAKLEPRSIARTVLYWWCKRHNLPEFSLNQIRTSVLNVIYSESKRHCCGKQERKSCVIAYYKTVYQPPNE